MKLASLKDGSRDGRLLVVRDDLERAVMAETVHTLQAALDDWAEVAPKLAHEADALARHAREDAFAFDPNHLMAPLPRAYQWADGSAYVNHVALVRKARGAEMPESFWSEPLMYQGGSDAFLGPREPIVMAEESWGIDFEAEVAVILDDVPMGATPEQAAAAIRLVLLVNDVSLRNLVPGELSKGFGFFQSKPSCAASPVAVTPAALGDAWDGGKLNLPMLVSLNGEPFGKAEAGEDMTFDFPALIAHAARTRRLSAGTIVGSGTVSNRDAEGGPGRPVAEGGRGYSCIAEQRTVETLLHGEAKTPFLRFGDSLRIEMRDGEGRPVFGAIEQRVEQAPA